MIAVDYEDRILASLSEPALHPAQLTPRSDPVGGERRLLVALIQDALDIIFEKRVALGAPSAETRKRNREEAERWVEDRRYFQGSFEWAAGLLGIDPDWLRRKIDQGKALRATPGRQRIVQTDLDPLTPTKLCAFCGHQFGRAKDRTLKQFEAQKYCSNACSGAAGPKWRRGQPTIRRPQIGEVVELRVGEMVELQA